MTTTLPPPDVMRHAKARGLVASRGFRAAALIAILILAAFLRIHGIAHDSLWGDEALGLKIARMQIADLFHFDIAWEQIPPAHHLLLHFWTALFGVSETSVRMPSALAGIAAVWMAYSLMRRLMGWRIALATMLLVAVSPMQIAYSQECRAYTLSVFFGLASCDLFVRLLRRPTPRLQAIYVVVSAIFLYTHLYSIFTILAQHVYYAFCWWRARGKPRLNLKTWITCNVAVAALFSPWVPTVLLWMRMVAVNFWVKRASWEDIPNAYLTFSGSGAALLLIAALVIVGLWFGRRRRGLILVAMLMILPVFVPAVIAILTHPSFAPRYAIMASVGMCAVASVGIMSLRKPWRLPALTVLALISPFGSGAKIPRAPWRDAGNFLNHVMRPGDVAIVQQKATTRLYDYYVHRPDVQRSGFDGPGAPISLPLPPGQHVWFVVQDERSTAKTVIDRGPFHILSARHFGEIWVFELTDIVSTNVPSGLTTSTSSTRPSAASHRPSSSR